MTVRLGHVAQTALGKMLQSRPLRGDDVEVAYLRAGLLGATPESEEDLPKMFASPSEIDAYTVRSGDLLVAEGGDVGRAEFTPPVPIPTIIQNSLHRVRTETGDIRFLRYSLLAIKVSGWLDVLVNRSTFGHLTVEKLRSLRVAWPPVDDQREVADFLDGETARIDALIAKKRRMLEVFGELRWLALEIALSKRGFAFPDSVDPGLLRNAPLPSDWMAPKLSSVLLQLTNGYVGPTRDILRGEGVRYIQGLHIKQGLIDFERRPYFVEGEWHDAHPRTALRPGDVLIVQTGDIGQVTVVPDGFGPANCHALLIARANPDFVSGIFLGMYLQSWFGYNSLVRVATGALHPHLEFGIRDVPVLIPPKSVQREVVAEVSQRQGTIDRAVARLTRQIDLLTERRQALITAAVTGELAVSDSIAKEAS